MTYPQPEDAPFLLKVKMGLVPGHKIVHAYGFNPDVDVSTKETIWSRQGLYEFQTIAKQTYISSSNSADTTQLFQAVMLDENFVEHIDIIALNGQTAVPLPDGIYIRCNGLSNVSPGENPTLGGVSIGTESVPVGGLPSIANTLAHARAEAQIDEQAVYTIPRGKTGFILNLSASVGKGKDAIVHGAFREANGTFKNTEQLDIYEETIQRTIPFSTMPEKSDLMMVGTTENNNSDMAAGFDIIIINNEYINA